MINIKDISILKYTSLMELINDFYQAYAIKNLKQRILEYFISKGIDPDFTLQLDWKLATEYIQNQRAQGILSQYFETVEQQIFNTTSIED